MLKWTLGFFIFVWRYVQWVLDPAICQQGNSDFNMQLDIRQQEFFISLTVTLCSIISLKYYIIADVWR